MTLNESRVKKTKPVKEKPAVEAAAPEAFLEALRKNKQAQAIFESKSPSYRKNYIIWVADAKTDETRQKRIAQSLE